MSTLQELYLELIHCTLLIAREASWDGDSKWCEQEIELIHNLPHAISNARKQDHLYFWNVSRKLFIEWIVDSNHSKAERKYGAFQKGSSLFLVGRTGHQIELPAVEQDPDSVVRKLPESASC